MYMHIVVCYQFPYSCDLYSRELELLYSFVVLTMTIDLRFALSSIGITYSSTPHQTPITFYPSIATGLSPLLSLFTRPSGHATPQWR